MSLLIIGLLVVSLILWRICIAGTFRIEWDGGFRKKYYVWRRSFDGFDELIGSAYTEEEARSLIERYKANPSRKIQP